MSDGNFKFIAVAAVALVALAAIVLIGLALTVQYDRLLRDSATVINTTTGNNWVVNTTVAVGTAGQYGYLQSLTNCINSSNVSQIMGPGNYTVIEGDRGGGRVRLLTTTLNNSPINCTITWLNQTTESDSAVQFGIGMSIFATTDSVYLGSTTPPT